MGQYYRSLCLWTFTKWSYKEYLSCHPPTFLSPVKKGSDFDSAEAVGGVGGELLHTPRVAMATPRKAGTENISN